ncbi:UPF0149 family protein [Halotalea alkalilenta]|uniref:YecA family protein n=1 Tax=Halotalea alkalilenta TaxID=376489 RepID=A0A172YBN9_9GAMM|nr:UPF0149 family protein [Halotalea alkalilenta]ANF56628.1 hypothetical protein A5892_03405 [Halotalea alkalilenta]
MSDDLRAGDTAIDFATIADLFLSYGSLASPAFLDGRMSARLALGENDGVEASERWLAEVCEVLGVESPRDRDDAGLLLGWRVRARARLADEEMSFEPLLPDELFTLTERAEGLKAWCQGFSEALDDHGIDERWSAPLREALDDLRGIGELDLDEGVKDDGESEADLLALAEHARVAAILLYLECHPGNPRVEGVDDDGVPPRLH